MVWKFASTDGLWSSGLGLREPKKDEGLAARDTVDALATDEGLEGAFDPAGLNEGAVGLNSGALKLNLAADVADMGV